MLSPMIPRRKVIVATIYPKQGKLLAHPGRIVGRVHVDVPGRGNRCCVCHRKRPAVGNGRPVGPRWWGGRSRGFRPRRRRLSLRRGGIAVVAAVRYDPTAVSQYAVYALFFVSHVLSVGSCQETVIFSSRPPFFDRGNILPRIAIFRVLRVR